MMTKNQKCKQCCRSVAAGAVILGADDICQFCQYENTKALSEKDKLNLSDWDRLNNEVTALTGNSQVHNRHILSLFEEVANLTDSQQKLMDTLETQLGAIRDLHDTVKTQTRMIDRLKLRVTDLEVADISASGGSKVAINLIPKTTTPSKDNTSKLLLKRFLAVQRICEASLELDRHRAVAPSDDRQWLAQSVLNILNGNVDE